MTATTKVPFGQACVQVDKIGSDMVIELFARLLMGEDKAKLDEEAEQRMAAFVRTLGWEPDEYKAEVKKHNAAARASLGMLAAAKQPSMVSEGEAAYEATPTKKSFEELSTLVNNKIDALRILNAIGVKSPAECDAELAKTITDAGWEFDEYKDAVEAANERHRRHECDCYKTKPAEDSDTLG